MKIEPAQNHEIPIALALVEALLAELGEEGQEFAGIDRDKLQVDLQRNLASGRFLALLAKDASGTPIGVLTLSQSFALYAGGEYGVIDEMYVLPEHRGQGVGRALIEAAVTIARHRRWFRLDVTGPEGEGGESGKTTGEAGVASAGPGAPVRRFYERAGFEFTGCKLRLLV
jgi:GNAT superfamily N-acetyltransferase